MIGSLGRFVLTILAIFFAFGLMLIAVGSGSLDKDTVESFSTPFVFLGILAFATVMLSEVLS
jgi:hypothetical protein